jgi:hypothetical protein
MMYEVPVVGFLTVAFIYVLQRCLNCQEAPKLPRELLPRPLPYEGKYPLDTGEIEESPANQLARRVQDETPQGVVAMTYDAASNTFSYWADASSVQYKYLDTVARKWVIVYDQRDVYVNLYRELLEHPTKDGGFKKERLNRYVCRGRFSEPEPPQPPPAAPKPITYADFCKKK